MAHYTAHDVNALYNHAAAVMPTAAAPVAASVNIKGFPDIAPKSTVGLDSLLRAILLELQQLNHNVGEIKREQDKTKKWISAQAHVGNPQKRKLESKNNSTSNAAAPEPKRRKLSPNNSVGTPLFSNVARDICKPFVMMKRDQNEAKGEGRIIIANKAFCNLLGYAQTDIVGRKWMEFVAEESRTQAILALAPITISESAARSSLSMLSGTTQKELDDDSHDQVGQTTSLHMYLAGKMDKKVEVITRHQIYYDSNGDPYWGVLEVSDVINIYSSRSVQLENAKSSTPTQEQPNQIVDDMRSSAGLTEGATPACDDLNLSSGIDSIDDSLLFADFSRIFFSQ
eukprot:TRINITY_DN16461_c0_g1_i1.p1 TRINITY_DN16461_c0_g1~~TRINITY_DN16461_c0_g1_i1.p1  ORF type:complete len:341 (+),score=55.38 TRINITY_DN16461_c0_g1_i1:334-1356(+)